jgi:hypothetical protein
MNQPDGFIDSHGGFRNLKSYQMAGIVYVYQDFLRQPKLRFREKNNPRQLFFPPGPATIKNHFTKERMP